MDWSSNSLDGGQSKNAWFVVVAWGCWRAVEPRLRQHRSAAVGKESRAEPSRVERSGLAPWPGQWRGRGLGLRPGQGGWSVHSGGGVGGRGRSGGGGGTSLCAAAIYGQEVEMIICNSAKSKENPSLEISCFQHCLGGTNVQTNHKSNAK